MKVFRSHATREGVLNVSANRAWALLTEWEAVLKWWDNRVPGDAMRLSGVELEGDRNAVPRTRVLTRSNATQSGLPLVNRETLLLQDDDLMRIYYDADDGVIAGVRNYIATTYIDAIAQDSCRVTCDSRFDVTPDQDANEVRLRVESVYDGIICGFRDYFSKQKDGA